MPCGAVLLCDAVRVRYSKCHTTGTTAVRTRYYMLNHKKCSHSSVQLSPAIAQQRSAAQRRAVLYGAVSCPAVLCRAALRCAFFRTYSSTRCHAIPGTDRYVCAYVYSSFFFFLLIVLSQSLLSPPCPPPEKYTHTRDQNVTSPTSTHNKAQRNQLCVRRSSWRYQIARRTKSWASSFCRLHA